MSRERRFNDDAFRYYRRLERLRQHVEAHLSEPIPLDRAARVASLEKHYFSTFFHEKVGVTYTDWLRTRRVEAAMQLLRARNRSIAEVAYTVGFRDLRTFQRAFKAHTSMTPSAFRGCFRPRASSTPGRGIARDGHASTTSRSS